MSDGKRPNTRTEDPTDFEYSGAIAEVLQDEGCVTAASGRVLCISSASSTARPDNGTPGTPATPDGTITYTAPYGVTNNSTTVVNVYNSSTVTSSTNYGTGSPTPDDGQAPTDGDGKCDYGENANSADCSSSGGDGDGEGEGGGDCDPATETCSFGPPTAEYDFGDWEDEIAEASTELTATIANVRAEAATLFGSISVGGNAKLPCTDFQMWGKTIDFCFTPYEDQLITLRQILLLMAAVFVVVIILR